MIVSIADLENAFRAAEQKGETRSCAQLRAAITSAAAFACSTCGSGARAVALLLPGALVIRCGFPDCSPSFRIRDGVCPTCGAGFCNCGQCATVADPGTFLLCPRCTELFVADTDRVIYRIHEAELEAFPNEAQRFVAKFREHARARTVRAGRVS